MKKVFFALVMGMFTMSVNAASANKATASEKIANLVAEQSAIQDQAMRSDIETAIIMEDFVIEIDRKIEALMPELLAERETLREQALNCGNNVVKAMELTKKVIKIDDMLDFLGYEEPADDAEDCE